MKNIFKTLYIHGLDSSPKKNKLNIIKKKSTDFSFHLDYRNETNTFKILSDCIKENNINSVIGSSFGGMLGYWLSKKHKIPSLLFAARMSSRRIAALPFFKSLTLKLARVPEFPVAGSICPVLSRVTRCGVSMCSHDAYMMTCSTNSRIDVRG